MKRYPRFIGGTRASGSWLLHDILAEHPMVYSFPMEIQVHKQMREIDCDPLLKGRIIEAIFFAMGNSARARWQLTKDSQKPKAQGQVWIDKEPEYSWKYKELLAMFPNMKIVNVVRDLRDTACSRYKRWKDKSDPVKVWHQACNQVETLQIAIQRQFKTLGPAQSLIISMEDLVFHPGKTLREVCAFFDLPWHPPLVEYQFDRKRIGVWKTEMPKQIRPCENYKQGYYYEGE